MNLYPALSTFLEESRELLAAMEQAAMQLEKDPGDAESIHAMFRAAHTIKGSAGLFCFNRIVDFTHVVESVLDQVRQGQVAITAELSSALLGCCDHMGAMIEAVATSQEDGDEALQRRGQDLLARLPAVAPRGGAITKQPAAAGGGGGGGKSEAAAENRNWHISLRFQPDVLKNGMDPMSFIGYLGKLGELAHVVTLIDALPPAAEMDPECCYLGFEIALRADTDKQAIEAVFEFVQESCALRILPPQAALSGYADLIRQLPEEPMRVGEILIECGALTRRELSLALQQQAAEGEKRPVGEILIEQGVVHPESVDAAVAKQGEVRERKAQESRTLRVDTDKLDRLINLVGELVVAGANTTLLSRKCGDSQLQASAEVMSRLVEDIRESALRLRMVQIGETFNRFHRVVRDVSQQLGKDIALSISGGDTELDKAMVEKIGDPLTHLVRNAMDHGIEPVAVRLERGKPAQGTLRLHAYHDSGNVVIEISDDGGGLNRQKIRQRAIERGLIAEGQVLSDGEICDLIFKPGFSTAEKVTDLSGRGVGMDVVRHNVEALRGAVEIGSVEGKGSTIRIRLPLTLAIIDGFLVRVGDSDYVVPLDTVVECVELGAGTAGGEDRGHYINLRGQVLPFLRLRDLFSHPGTDGGRESVVVVQYAGKKAGLVVDELLGEFQAVIKPLGKIFQHLRGISGSTVLGSGQVALILDVPSLVQHTTQGQRAAQGVHRKGPQGAAMAKEETP